MLIQDAIFPDLNETDVKPVIESEERKEEQIEITDLLPKTESAKNKGGRPKKK